MTNWHPYTCICAKKASPIVANGGDMLGCANGHWVMGTLYTQVDSRSYLPPTIVYGIYSVKVYDQIKPIKIDLNETVMKPAECQCDALVHRDHRQASAAEFSNVGGEWCKAVFNAGAILISIVLLRLFRLISCMRRRGVIYDPVVQTCVFA